MTKTFLFSLAMTLMILLSPELGGNSLAQSLPVIHIEFDITGEQYSRLNTDSLENILATFAATTLGEIEAFKFVRFAPLNISDPAGNELHFELRQDSEGTGQRVVLDLTGVSGDNVLTKPWLVFDVWDLSYPLPGLESRLLGAIQKSIAAAAANNEIRKELLERYLSEIPIANSIGLEDVNFVRLPLLQIDLRASEKSKLALHLKHKDDPNFGGQFGLGVNLGIASIEAEKRSSWKTLCRIESLPSQNLERAEILKAIAEELESQSYSSTLVWMVEYDYDRWNGYEDGGVVTRAPE